MFFRSFVLALVVLPFQCLGCISMCEEFSAAENTQCAPQALSRPFTPERRSFGSWGYTGGGITAVSNDWFRDDSYAVWSNTVITTTMSTERMIDATISYRYDVGTGIENSDIMIMELSTNGATWTRIDSHCCPVSNYEVGTRTATIPTDFIGLATVYVRIGVQGYAGSNEYLVIRGVSVNATTCVTPGPTPAPTPQPTANPTPLPTPNPTPPPTVQPTTNPTPQPTLTPTVQPTASPTPFPTVVATASSGVVSPTASGTSPTVSANSPTAIPAVSTSVPPEVVPGQTTGGGGLVTDADNVATDEGADGDSASLIVPIVVAVVGCCLLILFLFVIIKRRRAQGAAAKRATVLGTNPVAAGPQVSERSAAAGAGPAAPHPGAKRRSRSNSRSKRAPALAATGGTYSSVSDVIAGPPGTMNSIYSAAPAGGRRTTAPPPVDLYGPITGVPSNQTGLSGNQMYGPITPGQPASGTYEATTTALGGGAEPTNVQYGTLAPDPIIYSSL